MNYDCENLVVGHKSFQCSINVYFHILNPSSKIYFSFVLFYILKTYLFVLNIHDTLGEPNQLTWAQSSAYMGWNDILTIISWWLGRHGPENTFPLSWAKLFLSNMGLFRNSGIHDLKIFLLTWSDVFPSDMSLRTNALI